MPRIMNLTEKPLAGAEFVVNAADDEAGVVPAGELATAAQGALADSAVQSVVNGTNISVNATDPQNPIVSATGVAAQINAATGKTTPVDADELGIVDSAASNVLKKLTWANLKATLKTYLDTLYQVLDQDLTDIAGLSPTNDDVMQRKAGAWTNRSLAQLKTDLSLQPLDQDLTDIAALSPANNDFMQRKSGAWTNRTPTQATADLIAMVGDSGSGGTKGLVPAPASGDAAAGKYLKADGSWATPPGGGGSGDVTGPASSTAAGVAGFNDTTGKVLKQLSSTELRAAATLATTDSPQFTGINLGHASDTTLTRVSAGVVAVEGSNILLASGLGSITQAYDSDLAAVAALSATGVMARTGAGTAAVRTITGTANQITITNGDGVSGNPTLSLPADVIIPTALTVPNTGLHLLDTNASHDVILKPGSDVTADRTVTIITGDADRTLDLTVSASGALVYLSTSPFTAQASVEFTGLSSSYDEFVIVLEDVFVSSGTPNLLVTMSTDNGSSYIATGYSFGWQQIGASGTNAGTASTTSITAIPTLGSTDGAGASGELRIFTGATDTARSSFVGHRIANNTISGAVSVGSVTLSGTRVNAVKMAPSTAVNMTGRALLYGVKNS